MLVVLGCVSMRCGLDSVLEPNRDIRNGVDGGSTGCVEEGGYKGGRQGGREEQGEELEDGTESKAGERHRKRETVRSGQRAYLEECARAPPPWARRR